MHERREEFGLTHRPFIPPEWEETIAACLAKEPESRPATAREIAARLRLRGAPPVIPAVSVESTAPSVPSTTEEAATIHVTEPAPSSPAGSAEAVTIRTPAPQPEVTPAVPVPPRRATRPAPPPAPVASPPPRADPVPERAGTLPTVPAKAVPPRVPPPPARAPEPPAPEARPEVGAPAPARSAGARGSRLLVGALVLALLLLLGIFAPSLSRGPAGAPPRSGEAPLPVPTTEQRVAAMEAYFSNTSSTLPLTGPDGTVPPGLTTVAGSHPGPGHQAWILGSTALMALLVLPGLSLFQGGLLPGRHGLQLFGRNLACLGVVAFVWWAAGYSLVYGVNWHSSWLGGAEYLFFRGTLDTSSPADPNYSVWVSRGLFATWQLFLAAFPVFLIMGAVAGSLRLRAALAFTAAWMLLVYCPLAHFILGATGFLNGLWNADARLPTLDFAGGAAVHMAAGWSALTLCLVVRRGVLTGSRPDPAGPAFCLFGTGLLWAGWYGLTAGSSLAADGVAGTAFTTTTLAAAAGAAVSLLLEVMRRGRVAITPCCRGLFAGLVGITPACGFVSPLSAVLIGSLASAAAWVWTLATRRRQGFGDATHTFAICGLGGAVGVLLTGLLATETVNANLAITTGSSTSIATVNGLAQLVANHTLILHQALLVLVVVVVSVVGTLLATLLARSFGTPRPAPEDEPATQPGLNI